MGYSTSRCRSFIAGLAAAALLVLAASRANAEAKLLFDAGTGKVLQAENATYPWYPASLTKLMTMYTTLREIAEGRVNFDTLLTVSRLAAAQQPTKMGFKVGTRVTIDNALKMLMVKSANDMAVAIAEGVGGSVDGFARMMNVNALRLGMSQSHFVNPNGLPAEDHYTSARDLGILARALITEFPQYDFYWHIHSIRYGNRVIRNYNPLLDRYPGADGMKTGFICASGYNLVASATRNGRRLIAIVLGASSGKARAQEAAQMLENGFSAGGLSWLMPSLGTVDELAPINAQPANLRDEMCGGHRHTVPTDDTNEEEANNAASGDGQVFMLSNLKPATGNFVLGPPIDTEPPIVVFTGPADHPDPIEVASPARKKKKKVAARHEDAKPAETKEGENGSDAAKSAKSAKGKRTTSAKPAKSTKKPAKAAHAAKKTAKPKDGASAQ